MNYWRCAGIGTSFQKKTEKLWTGQYKTTAIKWRTTALLSYPAIFFKLPLRNRLKKRKGETKERN